MDITELLERAVADVVPSERRPTDAVLRLAESRQLGSRIRKAFAGLVGVAVLGGGAVVVATGNDDGDRETEPPRPLTLQVDLPTGWSEVTEPTTIDCTTQIQPRSVYRDVELGDLGYCRPAQPISVTGPSLLIGRLPADVAEMARAVGTPVEAGGVPGYATSYDGEFSYVVWLPAGSVRNLAYAVVAPRTEDGVAAYDDKVGGGSPSLPRELVDLVGTVTADGDLPRAARLPAEVSAVDLRLSPDNVDPQPGARILEPSSVSAVLAELDAAAGAVAGGTGACGPTERARTMHLQDARSHRWVRVDVLEDATGCRTVRSELGGSHRVPGDPVKLATALAEPQHVDVELADERRTANGFEAPVPAGWQVVERATVDPCTLAGPSVVVAAELRPSCAAEQYMRPTHPYLWVTSSRLEDRELFSGPGRATGSPVAWRTATLDADGIALTGRLGVPERGDGRLFLGGLEAGRGQELLDGVRLAPTP
jgi:hypothetical protein